jgi:ubiquinone/menaquinone biosynthesis C-methylase UbiE
MTGRPDRTSTGSAPTNPDFGRIAASYDELRPTDANWWEVFEVLVQEGDLVGRRVLEVGTGTGRVAAALAERGSRVWGVEPEPEMAARAKERISTVKIAPAESLPFKDGWFDRAVMFLVIHLVDRPVAFAEARRVLGPEGRLVIATFDPAHFERYWLNRFFPSLEAIDRARFPGPEALDRELAAAGFASVRLVRLSQKAVMDRESALTRVRGRFISPLQLLTEEEYEAGLRRLEAELPEQSEYALEWVVAVAYR